jgi:hypothetical protein
MKTSHKDFRMRTSLFLLNATPSFGDWTTTNLRRLFELAAANLVVEGMEGGGTASGGDEWGAAGCKDGDQNHENSKL